MNSTSSTGNQAAAGRWLTIGTARNLLHLSETTLRHWANTGLVRTYRTPGGHRRFSSEDIKMLVQSSNRKGLEPSQPAASEDALLQGIRRRLSKAPDDHSLWSLSFGVAGQQRMRELGRSLVSVCSQLPSRQRIAQIAASVRSIGFEQGSEAASRGIPLGQSLQAFTFFRTALLETFKENLPVQKVSAAQLARVWRQVIWLTDESLVGLVSGYEQAMASKKNRKVHVKIP